MESLNFHDAADLYPRAIQRLLNPPVGIPLPAWPKFNEFLGGLRMHELTLFCAPTGGGKTQFLANVSAQLLKQDIPHFVAPVETGDIDFLIRVMSTLDGRDYKLLDRLDMFDHQRLEERMRERFAPGKIWISTYDNRVDIAEMATLLKFQAQQGARVAVLDNLNFFLRVTSSQMEKAEMDEAMHTFVMLTKKIPIHVILVCHPRKTDGEGRVDSEFDIKGSSTAVQEASNVMLFNRPSLEQLRDGRKRSTDRELVFRKIRERGIHVGKPIWFSYTEGRYEEY